MKKIIGMATSFVLGFAFFAAGGAVAIEATNDQAETTTDAEVIIVEEPEEIVVIDDSEEIIIIEEPSFKPLRSNDNPVFCWNIGKGNELDGDCFCVEGYVTDMIEVDCLIASGIVEASKRESYEYELTNNN